MYLKSLELHGFKSFPNRTVLTFERGATVIVGPNGSGKSNISDAMRWVLGELSSRNIRGTRMEDVIFGGTDDRRPMGFAEVSVTFDNTDVEHRLDSPYDEVIVTRRYFRTGESEYLINRQPKRLRDIYELFMNTGVGREGYSIIGQGKIAEIVSKKSDERRNIFEEAAGISKYRHRKEESERKLKQTQDNLDRVRDILTELENRVVPLEKEAEKARKGLAIYEEKKRADVSLWLFDTKKIRDDIEEADKNLKLAKHELEIIDQLIADLEAQSDNLYLKEQSNKSLSAQLLEEIRVSTERLHALDNALKVADTNYSHFADLIEQCRDRIKEITESRLNLEGSLSDYNTRKDGMISKRDEHMEIRLGYLSEQQHLAMLIETARRELEEALDELTVEENSATSLKVRIDVLKNAKIADGSRSQDIEKEIEKYEAEALVLKEEAELCDKNAAGFREKISEKESIISETSCRVDDLTNRRTAASEQLAKYILERDTLVQRADVLQRMNDHFEGYSESIKYVMKEYNAGRISGVGVIYGPLSSLINVEKQYITAIETALGSSLQNIVVESEGTAKAAMRSLKAGNAGRATFYPISAIRPATETDEIRMAKGMPGFIGRADMLVDTDERYRSIIEWLLLRTVVFDNLDAASVAAKKLRYKVRVVTLDGQIINTGGSFTGGSAKRDSGILSRLTTIVDLKEKANAFSETIKVTERELNEIEESISNNKNTQKIAEQERELLLTLSRSQFAALDNANAKYNANREILDKLRMDYDALVSNQSRADDEILTLSAEYGANLERIEALKSFRARKSDEMGVLDEKSDELGQKSNDEFIRVTEIKKDIEGIDQMIASINGRISDLDGEAENQQRKIDELEYKRSNIGAQQTSDVAEYEKTEKELKTLRQKRQEVEDGTDEFEREINEVRAKIKDRTSARNVSYESALKSENRLNQLVEKQDKLGSVLWDDYELTYEDAIALEYPAVTAENRDEIAAVQTSCRARLRALGNYNPGAIEEYAEVKTRYDALNTQFVDLTNSYDELVNIISRLEEEMRTSFITSFESINKNFGITFKELFGGGNAELLLTEPEDVLTSGIEIKAAPPGKIIKNLSLLSGGEQSFVAIALLFAILKVNPTPFCILDEIEAALDEVNVFRFAEYVRKFDDGTQFILITHRRGTMEVGDKIYGVTMPQRGISQAIELDVTEIEGKQKELLDGVL